MRRGIEVRSQSSSYYNENSNWLLFQESKGITKWTIEENKRFENALALYDKETSDRWIKVAAMIPGKTIDDVIKHYKDLEEDVCVIESGLIPFPGYTTTSTTSSFTLDYWNDNQGFDGLNKFYSVTCKRGVSTRSLDHERKKGVPWTKEEHRLFLMGLKKYGKGDWRNIARNFVTTRTPTQVASHAQKYFIRQVNGGKDKRRSSIHDITIVNLSDTKSPSLEESNITRFSDNHSAKAANANPYPNQKFFGLVKQECDMKFSYEGVANVFNYTNGNMFMMTPQEQCLIRGTNGCQIGPYDNTIMQMQSLQHQ